ncbi:MAG: flippase [Minisyncoccia bacterium]
MMQRIKNFLFKNTSDKQTVVKNTFWLFLGEVVGRLLKLALIIYTARVLGAEGWGVFSYALSLASLLMVFSDVGITGLITREIIQKKKDFSVFISTALLAKTIFLFASTLLVLFAGPFLSHIPEARVLFPLFAIVLFFDAARDLILAINIAFEKMEKDMLVKTSMGVITLILGVILLRIEVAPISVAIAYAVGSTVGCVMAFLIIKKDLKGLFSKSNSRTLRLVLQTTWPFAIVTLIGIITGATDVYMLGIWRDPTEIGLYTSAQRIQQFIIIIPIMLGTAVFPLLSRLVNTDNNQFGIVLEKTLSFVFAMGIPIVCGGILLSSEIMTFLFGTSYVNAGPLLQMLMVSLLASLPLAILSNSIFAHNGQKNIAIAYLSGLGINILLNIFLIPQYGALGAAFATVLSTTIITVIIWSKLKNIQRFEILPRLKKVFLSTASMIISILLLKQIDLHVVITILISSFVYIGSLLLLKESILSEARSLLNNKSLV